MTSRTDGTPPAATPSYSRGERLALDEQIASLYDHSGELREIEAPHQGKRSGWKVVGYLVAAAIVSLALGVLAGTYQNEIASAWDAPSKSFGKAFTSVFTPEMGYGTLAGAAAIASFAAIYLGFKKHPKATLLTLTCFAIIYGVAAYISGDPALGMSNGYSKLTEDHTFYHGIIPGATGSAVLLALIGKLWDKIKNRSQSMDESPLKFEYRAEDINQVKQVWHGSLELHHNPLADNGPIRTLTLPVDDEADDTGGYVPPVLPPLLSSEQRMKREHDVLHNDPDTDRILGRSTPPTQPDTAAPMAPEPNYGSLDIEAMRLYASARNSDNELVNEIGRTGHLDASDATSEHAYLFEGATETTPTVNNSSENLVAFYNSSDPNARRQAANNHNQAYQGTAEPTGASALQQPISRSAAVVAKSDASFSKARKAMDESNEATAELEERIRLLAQEGIL